MQISQYGALVGLLGAVQASPTILPGGLTSGVLSGANLGSHKGLPDLVGADGGKGGYCSSDITNYWKDKDVYNGLAPGAQGSDGINLGVSLSEASLQGSVGLGADIDFLLAPTLKVDLGGVKAHLQVAIDATADVEASINIWEDLNLTLDIPGLLEGGVKVGFALDLVLSLSAAIDLETIFDVYFPEGCYVEINIITKEIVKQDLVGLVVSTSPLSIGADVALDVDIELEVCLRLRTGVAVAAGLDIVGLDLGVGAQVAIWINLFDYTSVYAKVGSGAEVSVKEVFALTAGVLVDVNVDSKALDLALAPTALVTLSAHPAVTVQVTIGAGASKQFPWSVSGSSPVSGSGSGSVSGHGSGSGSDSGSSPVSGSGSGSVSGHGSGSGSVSGSGSGSGSGSASVPGSVSGSSPVAGSGPGSASSPGSASGSSPVAGSGSLSGYPTGSESSSDKSPSSGDKSPSSGDKSPSSGDKSPSSGYPTGSDSSSDKSPSSGDKSPSSGDKSPSSGDKSGSYPAGSYNAYRRGVAAYSGAAMPSATGAAPYYPTSMPTGAGMPNATSSAGGMHPTVVTAGAGKLGLGLVAVFAPLFVALL